MLYLARPMVQDQPLPWHIVSMSLREGPQQGITPGRVKGGIVTVFHVLVYSASPPVTAWNSSRMAKRQAKEATGTIFGSTKSNCAANSHWLCGLKLDC